MNLADLRTLVGNLGEYDPNTSAYNAQVDRLINNTYGELFGMAPWTFAQKEVEITARPDVSNTTGIVTQNSKAITTVSAFFDDWMEGQVIEIATVEYEVAQVTSTTAAYLTIPYAAANGANVSFTVKHRYVDLPSDAISVIQVGQYEKATGNDNLGRIIPLARYEGDFYSLSYKQTGTPTYWLPSDAVLARPPAVTATLTTQVGTWPAGTYEFRVGHNIQNRYSAPFPTSISYVATGATQPVLTFNNNVTGSGYRHVIYVKPPGYTAFRLFQDNIAAAGGAIVMATPPASDFWQNTRAPEGGGHYQRIRLFPRQDTSRTLTVRYLFRPSLLVEDQDQPELPEPYHHVVAEMAMTEVYARKDNLAQSEVYRRKALVGLEKLRQRFLTEIPRRMVKGSGWLDWNARYMPRVTLTHIG